VEFNIAAVLAKERIDRSAALPSFVPLSFKKNYQVHAYQKISAVTTTVEMPRSNW